MSGVIANLTPSIVAACADAEAKPSADYLAARDLLPAMASRYADAADVASVAAVLLGSVMLDVENNVTKAAGSAVKRAAAWCHADYAKDDAAPIGDTFADVPGVEHIGHATYTRPDAIATWHASDTLDYVADALDDSGQTYMAALRTRSDVWVTDKRAKGCGNVNARALCRAVYGDDASGNVRKIASAVLSDTLDDLRTAGRYLDRDLLPTFSTGWDAQRGTLRDTSIADSGTASAVVRTLPSGQRWTTLPDRSVMLDDDTAQYVLSRSDVLPAYDDATSPAREVTHAGLAAPRDLLPARRPSGVGVGMVYGSGQRAGAGTPELRPSAPRKRKRDGSIGTSMTRA